MPSVCTTVALNASSGAFTALYPGVSGMCDVSFFYPTIAAYMVIADDATAAVTASGAALTRLTLTANQTPTPTVRLDPSKTWVRAISTTAGSMYMVISW